MSAEQPKIEPQRVELILGAWLNEDELPPGYPYHEMFEFSKLGQDGMGGVRIFPKLAESGRTSAHRYTSTACQHGKNDSSASVQPEGMTAEEFHGPVCSACAWENADKCEKRVSCTDKIKFAQVYADRLRGQGAPKQSLDDRMWAKRIADGIFGIGPCPYVGMMERKPAEGFIAGELAEFRAQGAETRELAQEQASHDAELRRIGAEVGLAWPTTVEDIIKAIRQSSSEATLGAETREEPTGQSDTAVQALNRMLVHFVGQEGDCPECGARPEELNCDTCYVVLMAEKALGLKLDIFAPSSSEARNAALEEAAKVIEAANRLAAAIRCMQRPEEK